MPSTNFLLKFGAPVTGLTDVGVTILDDDGNVVVARQQMAIDGEYRPYWYEVTVPVPDTFNSGWQRWDSTGNADVFLEDVFVVQRSSAFTVNDETKLNYIYGKVGLIGTGEAVFNPPPTDGNNYRIVKGMDYLASKGNPVEWGRDTWVDLTGADAVKLRIDGYDDVTGAATVTGDEMQIISFDLPHAVTDSLAVDNFDILAWAEFGTTKVPLIKAKLFVERGL